MCVAIGEEWVEHHFDRPLPFEECISDEELVLFFDKEEFLFEEEASDAVEERGSGVEVEGLEVFVPFGVVDVAVLPSGEVEVVVGDHEGLVEVG